MSVPVQAAVLRDFSQPFQVSSLTIGDPRPDEIRVKVVATGICHTDLIMMRGALRASLPAVLGHEGAGVVEAVGSSVTTHRPGDHVVLTFASCGACGACNAGRPSYCENFMPQNFACERCDGSGAFEDKPSVRSHFFGQSSFASYVLCSARNAVVVPKDVPLELLGPLGCGIQTGAGAVLNALRITPGSSFAVFGAGAVGISALMAAKVAGATTIVAYDANPARLDVASELGATHTILASDDAGPDLFREVVGRSLDYTLDTTGVTSVIELAIRVLGRLGTCGVLSGVPGQTAQLPVNQLFSGGQSIVGITEGSSIPSIFIPRLIDLYQKGLFPFDRLIRLFPFSEINEAIASTTSGEVIKPVVCFDHR